jgi:serine/threonine-protein kinase HipA
MKRTVGVFVGETPRQVGTLRFDSQGARQSAAFEYDRAWLGASDRFALAPDLPLVAGPQFHKPTSAEHSVFHGAIADTEPDGWARRVILPEEGRLESPPWHEEALRETAARHDAGKEQPVDWEAAKRELRKRAE